MDKLNNRQFLFTLTFCGEKIKFFSTHRTTGGGNTAYNVWAKKGKKVVIYDSDYKIFHGDKAALFPKTVKNIREEAELLLLEMTINGLIFEDFESSLPVNPPRHVLFGETVAARSKRHDRRQRQWADPLSRSLEVRANEWAGKTGKFLPIISTHTHEDGGHHCNFFWNQPGGSGMILSTTVKNGVTEVEWVWAFRSDGSYDLSIEQLLKLKKLADKKAPHAISEIDRKIKLVTKSVEEVRNALRARIVIGARWYGDSWHGGTNPYNENRKGVLPLDDGRFLIFRSWGNYNGSGSKMEIVDRLDQEDFDLHPFRKCQNATSYWCIDGQEAINTILEEITEHSLRKCQALLDYL